MTVSVAVRDSTPADVAAIHAIYAHHVRRGLASFEEIPPDTGEMARRREDVMRHALPFLAADMDGRLVGFAYAALYRTRSAYRFTLEDSIYVDAQCLGRGVGRALLGVLVERCTQLNYRQMIAVIGDSANHASIRLHAALGFTMTGTLHAVGFKFGRWVDSVTMQRPLGPGSDTLPT
jgi:L-amino acid N-acyltransferase YncA